MRTVLTLIVFAIVFVALAVSSYIKKSATFDEPGHLTQGYAVLLLHGDRLCADQPLFPKMWAALPLLTERNVWLDTNEVAFPQLFLYQKNNGDELLNRARFMVVLIGIALGVMVFLWSRKLYGFWPATLALAFYAIEPNILAHAGMVTHDMAITCFIFGAVYALWCLNQRVTVLNLALLGGCVGLAFASKFQAVLLVPLIMLSLGYRVCCGAGWPWGRVVARSFRARVTMAAVIVCITLTGTWLIIWMTYFFRYEYPPCGCAVMHLQRDPAFSATAPVMAAVFQKIEDYHLLPSPFTQVFLGNVGWLTSVKKAAFFLGECKFGGWRAYFPVAFLIKTPVSLLVAVGGAVFFVLHQWWSKKKTPAAEIFVLCPVILYFGAAISANFNLGLRHILPVYPFLFVLVAKCAAELLQKGKTVLVAVLLTAGIMEIAYIYPHYLSFFNILVGGPGNGHKYLIDSNLDWGQDLKLLKRWMDDHGIRHVNLDYFGTADPTYYGINHTHFMPYPDVTQRSPTGVPTIPGWFAISVQHIQDPAFPQIREFYRPLRDRKPDAVIGYSIHVYYVERPWW